MVTTASRKARTRSVPAAEPEESVTMPAPQPQPELTTLREVYDALVDRTGLRAEIINGRLIVSPLGTPDHQDHVGALYSALRPNALAKGWKIYPGLDICMDGSRDPYSPDLVIAPPDAPRWGNRELLASGLVMVGEVVSRASTTDDREHKRDAYAKAGIPLYILVDALATPPTVTIFSEPKTDRYTVSALATMGDPLPIPEPVDFTVDTAIFQ
ncbi:Uma2 family endonuclease [Nonomuraea sp. NPDC050663]|uniref:Uma2 family endonuclease n=1 Tax=Nonomuraea sp. NPDC050663 TaxID=3364370 RepID=UPI0037960A0A